MKRLMIFLLFILVLVACAPGAEPQANAPQDAVAQDAAAQGAVGQEETAVEPAAESDAPRVTEEQAAEAELPVAQEEPPVVEEAIEEPGAESAPPDSEPQELPAPEEETAASPTEEPSVAEMPEATGPVIVSGRTEEGAFFLGDVNAPVTVIDYSDFLWGSCRAYVLGTEPKVVEEYVNSGKVKIVFWPVLNHSNPSLYSTITSECVGQQDPDKFWVVHEMLFENQGELWSADRDYYVETAVSVGVDQATFEACYDGADALATVMELDAIRRERGIFSQPYFDINGEIHGGAPPFDVFSAVLDDSYNKATE